eukprot:14700649-Alexandrium_andersonii.AAC.1
MLWPRTPTLTLPLPWNRTTPGRPRAVSRAPPCSPGGGNPCWWPPVAPGGSGGAGARTATSPSCASSVTSRPA